MPKIIIILILAVVLCLGIVAIFGHLFFKNYQPGDRIEEICCAKCLDFISKTPDSEKCLANSEINDQCREFFKKILTKKKIV